MVLILKRRAQRLNALVSDSIARTATRSWFHAFSEEEALQVSMQRRFSRIAVPA
jgi:hypothetical protein